ncbi:hypothetical protein [Mobiluncus curtisii]|nr:hypothetical protein [Mobiluncus curtisii]
MEITENVYSFDGYYDYLIIDETGTYGVEYNGPETETDIPYRTLILDPETEEPLAGTGSTQEWPEFCRRGWTKSELWAGHREAWNLPTGKEAEKKFWGED